MISPRTLNNFQIYDDVFQRSILCLQKYRHVARIFTSWEFLRTHQMTFYLLWILRSILRYKKLTFLTGLQIYLFFIHSCSVSMIRVIFFIFDVPIYGLFYTTKSY